MRKVAERAMYSAMRERAPKPYVNVGRQGCYDVMDSLGIDRKQGFAWIEKWLSKGWWDYGVSLPCGWFTADAPEALGP